MGSTHGIVLGPQAKLFFTDVGSVGIYTIGTELAPASIQHIDIPTRSARGSAGG
jgi:hypothetical protein